MQLEKNISTLQEKIYGANFDISKFYVSDKEAYKNILSKRNPKMKKSDINSIVDGDEKNKLEGVFPLKENSQNYEEVRKIKREVREATLMLIKGQKLLLQDLIKTATQIVVAIPAISIMAAAPPWNVPAAISLVLLIIDAIF